MQKSISCPNCGSPLAKKQANGLYRCEYCQSVYRWDDDGLSRMVRGFLAVQARPARLKIPQRLAAFAAAVILAVIGALVLLNSYRGSAARIEIAESNTARMRQQMLPQTQAFYTDTKAAAAKRVEAELSQLVPILDSIGGMYFTGFMKNTGETVIDFPKAIVKLYDENGTELAGGYGYCTRDHLLPSEQSIIRVLIGNAPSYARFKAEVSVRAASPYLKIDRGEIIISDTEMNFSGNGRLDVTGRVRNMDKRRCKSVRLTAVIYKDGAIAGTGLTVMTDILSQGDSKEFSMYITGELDSADSMLFDYQARFDR